MVTLIDLCTVQITSNKVPNRGPNFNFIVEKKITGTV